MKAYPRGSRFFRDSGPAVAGGENLAFSPPESPLLAGPIPPSRTTTITYTYDPLYHLTAADYDTGAYFHYTYDAIGNRLTQETELLTNNYVYDSANRLTSVDGQAYTHDSNGNLLSDGASTYTYDKANRLSTVSQGGVSYSYAYNGLGDRLQQTVDTVTTSYTLDLAGGLTQVLTDGASTYLYGLGRIGEYNTAWNYYLTDALGSVRQLTDSTGAIALAQSYAPYGNLTESAGEISTSYGYAGEWTDGTGLQHLRARYLNTGIGRFISRDTWAGDYNRPLSLNRWMYVEGNPIMRVDPSGHLPCLYKHRNKEGELVCGFPWERYYGREPDYNGLWNVKQNKDKFEDNEAFIEGLGLDITLVAAAMAVQSEWYLPNVIDNFIYERFGYEIPGQGIGPANTSSDQIFGESGYVKTILNAVDGVNFEGFFEGFLECHLAWIENKENVDLLSWDDAIKAMAFRLAASTLYCPNCRRVDKIIIAGMAQNGPGFQWNLRDFKKFTYGANVYWNIKKVDWDKYFYPDGELPEPIDCKDLDILDIVPCERAKDFQGDWDERFMLHLFTQDLRELIDQGWERPWGVTNKEIDYILKLAKGP